MKARFKRTQKVKKPAGAVEDMQWLDEELNSVPKETATIVKVRYTTGEVVFGKVVK